MVFKKDHVPWNTGKKLGSLSDEHKRNISNALKGEKNPMYGKRHSEETKRKLSEAHKDKKLSEEHRRKISEACKGRKFSKEHRQKLSDAQKGEKSHNWGKTPSDESKRKMSEAKMGNKIRLGKPHSEETKRKMSEANKGEKNGFYGRHHSEESKVKIRKARLKQVFFAKDTSIEIAVQSELDRRGIFYEKHVPVCGVCQPDIVFSKQQVAVFADGDYWHSKDFNDGKTWQKDRYQDKTLQKNGWIPIRFWGSEIRSSVSVCVDKIVSTLEEP